MVSLPHPPLCLGISNVVGGTQDTLNGINAQATHGITYTDAVPGSPLIITADFIEPKSSLVITGAINPGGLVYRNTFRLWDAKLFKVIGTFVVPNPPSNGAGEAMRMLYPSMQRTTHESATSNMALSLFYRTNPLF